MKFSKREIKLIQQYPKVAKLAASMFLLLSLIIIVIVLIYRPYINDAQLKKMNNKNQIYAELDKIKTGGIDPELKTLIKKEVESNVDGFVAFEYFYYVVAISMTVISTLIFSLYFKIINLVLEKD